MFDVPYPLLIVAYTTGMRQLRIMEGLRLTRLRTIPCNRECIFVGSAVSMRHLMFSQREISLKVKNFLPD